MNFLQAINNFKSSVNNDSVLSNKWTVLQNNRQIVIPDTKVVNEELEDEFHYLDEDELYYWNLAIDDIINRRANESYEYYNERCDTYYGLDQYDTFAKEAMLNKEYLENYPLNDEDEEYYEEEEEV